MKAIKTLLAAVAAALLCGPLQAEEAQTRPEAQAQVILELNRIEPLAEACRLYLLLRNGRTDHFETLTLDLVFFDKNAIIDRRFSVQAGPLPGQKTSLRQLDVPNLSCENLGGLLLNDVPTCSGASEVENGCLVLVGLENRTSVSFFK